MIRLVPVTGLINLQLSEMIKNSGSNASDQIKMPHTSVPSLRNKTNFVRPARRHQPRRRSGLGLPTMAIDNH